ncbi:class I SAM-dependent methyltransferase [Enhygromyxa salina]|uniref:class I SAM-dependent methyltransferase n=1 Tax=Enhygromyxa salina TaxID=215803 RepID=UPI0015E7369A|nr:class I SAM-dependent methyltransferase [Enhygromyxa salina]
MPQPDWDERYATADLPWDTGKPDPHLVELVEAGVMAPGRVLEVGCGTGTNAIWLAERGFTVHGVDLSARAIAQANTKRESAGVSVEFSALDFLRDEVPGAPYEWVFDRGVFHVFDLAEDRAAFARRVAAALQTGGRWLSLAGSTEGPERDHGPPRRSARDLLDAVEPELELLTLRSTEFDADTPTVAKAWLMLTRVRELPAQPSTRRG